MCRIIEIIRHRFFTKARVLHAPGHEPAPTPSGRISMQVDPVRHALDLHLPPAATGPVYAHYCVDPLLEEDSLSGVLVRATAAARACGSAFRLWPSDEHGTVLSLRGETVEAVRGTATWMGIGAGQFIYGSDTFTPLG